MSIWEIIGTVLGVTGVWLMIRQNIWGWPVGLVQVAVYAWVFFDTKLYSDAILQVFFFAIQAYGWWHWLKGNEVRATSPAPNPRSEVAAPPAVADGGQEERCALPVTRLRGAAIAGWIALGAVLTTGWGIFMHRTTDAALPWWDAFILVFGLIAQWLQARKNLECWAGWIVVNTVAIGVYWAKDLRLTSGLYLIFWGMALWGWREWRGSIDLEPGAAAPSPRKERDEGVASPN
jgi:nicotinamide mononucleotide transporter